MTKYYLTEATATLNRYPESASDIYDAVLGDLMSHRGEYDTREAAAAALMSTRQYADVDMQGDTYRCTAAFVEEYTVTVDEDGDVIDRDFCGTWESSRIPARVIYQAGDSRKQTGKTIDFMLAVVEDRDGEEVELYAEAVNDTWDPETESYTDDNATYDELCVEIMNQANKYNVRPEAFKFWREY